MVKQQSYIREFCRYVALSVLGTLGVSCYILADTFFIAEGLGKDGLAALNLAIPVYNFIHGTGMMLGMGGGTKFSIYKSQNKEEEINRTYTNTVYMSIAFSALFMLSGFLFSDKLAMLLGADADISEMTNTYLLWLLLFSPAFIFNDILLCFVRNDENPQLPMVAMIVGSIANIALDYVFIFPMQMGIFGAILATGISPVISMMIMLPHWTKKRNSFRFIKTKMEISIAKQALSLGVPSLIAQASSGIVMIVFNIIILGLEGNTGVAAYGVIANISIVIVAVYTGIAQGAQPLMGRFYGAGDHRHTQSVFRYAMITMTVISLITYIFIFLFAESIAAIFNSGNNAELQQIAEEGLRLYFTSNIAAGYNIILAIFLTSIERALPAQTLSVLRGFLLIIPIAFIMSHLWGMTGVWLVYPITESLVAFLGVLIYSQLKRKV